MDQNKPGVSWANCLFLYHHSGGENLSSFTVEVAYHQRVGAVYVAL
jgi:hypothetical protein